MKKLLIAIILLLSLAAIVWLGASWLIGVKTEESVRQTLSSGKLITTSTNTQFPTHTLIDYQRTLFKAEAVTRMDVRNTPLSAWVNELQFQHRIEHGPLLWDGEFDVADLVALKHEKLLLALSRWQTRLDIARLDEDVRQMVKTAFSGEAPFSALSLIDYQQTVDYHARLAPFQSVLEADNQLQLAGIDFTGQFDLKASQPFVLDIASGLLEITNDRGRLYFPELSVQAQINEGHGAYTLEFSAPQSGLDIADESNQITFAMQGVANQRRVGEYLEGGVELKLERFSGMEYPLNNITTAIDFSGVNTMGFYAINELHNRWQDLRAQLDWNEEEIETPEARRDQVQLELAINNATSQLLQGIFDKALQAERSKFNFSFNVETDLGDLSQQADLTYTGAEREITLGVVADYELADWLSLLRGDSKLDMAQAIVPTDWQSWLNYPIERRSLLDSGDRYQMDLRLTGYDAELNNRVVVFDKLAGKFMPLVPDVNSGDELAVTPEILALIESKGLSSEVLQQLFDSNEVSAGVLETLRQLQVMNEQLQ